MARAQVVLQEKLTDDRGNLREMAIWKVEPTAKQPDGIRYRLAMVKSGEKNPAVLYDNHHPKGHHRHFEGVEESYGFAGLDQLIRDFMVDVSRATESNK